MAFEGFSPRALSFISRVVARADLYAIKGYSNGKVLLSVLFPVS